MKHFKAISASPRLGDEVYQQILEAIAAGAIDPNKRIVQEWLADQLQVSRTPIREALIRLENEGVLVRVGRSGYQVRPLNDVEVAQIYQAREAIECFSMACLSRHHNLDRVNRLKAIIITLEQQPKESARDYFEANRRVHRAFVEETQNPFLLEMFDTIWNRSSAFYLFSEMLDVDLSKSLKDHLILCDALAGGDEHHATQTMRAHIQKGLELQRDAIAINRSRRVRSKA